MQPNDEAGKAYAEVNQIFAERVARDVKNGDLIWIHDFQLMLAPKMIRRELESRAFEAKIGFFLHTPFPEMEIFTISPKSRAILDALLHCDLIGFHVDGYSLRFIDTCRDVLLVAFFL